MNHVNVQTSRPDAPPIDRAARRAIARRLHRLSALIKHGLADRHARFIELLDEIRDHADAAILARPSGAVPDRAAAELRLPPSIFARAGGEPLGEFLLIPFGDIAVERPLSGGDFTFTRAHADSARRWFQQLGRRLAIDYEHQSFDRVRSRPDGLRPAAGWIGGLEVRDDGLWATGVVWTEIAANLLRSGEYRYFSPVIFWTDEECTDLAGLGPVALTNDPAMHGVQPLAASRAAAQAAADPVERSSAGDDPDDSRRDDSDDSLLPAIADDLAAAEQEITMLRRQLEAQSADAFIERGMREGKILDSTSMDWRDDFLRDAGSTESRLARAPVLRPPGRSTAPSSPRAAADPRREMLGRWGIDDDDLKAYDRALAAGRVLRPAAPSRPVPLR